MQETLEDYSWLAVYDTGVLVSEHDIDKETGAVITRSFLDIDTARCVTLILHPLVEDRNDVAINIDVSLKRRAVFFRRRVTTISFNHQEPQEQPCVHAIGWETHTSTSTSTSTSTTEGVYIFVFSDGSVLVTSEKNISVL